jgi:hypothetical protein
MAVAQVYQESSSSNPEDIPSQSGERPKSQPQNNNRSSANSKKSNKNATHESSSSRRFTSAPHSSQNSMKKTATGGGSQPNLNVDKISKQMRVDFEFQRNNLKNSISSLSPRTRSRSSSGRRIVFQNQNSDTESTSVDDVNKCYRNNNALLIDNLANSRSVPDLSFKSNLDFRKVTSSPRNHCPCNWDIQDRNVLAKYMEQ